MCGGVDCFRDHCPGEDSEIATTRLEACKSTTQEWIQFNNPDNRVKDFVIETNSHGPF